MILENFPVEILVRRNTKIKNSHANIKSTTLTCAGKKIKRDNNNN